LLPNIQYTILAFVAIAALALVIQTIGIIVVMVLASKAVKSLRAEMEHYRSTLNPAILRSREVVQNISPKIEDAADQLNAITRTLRSQTSDIQAAADEIIGRTRHQVVRVDQMLTTIFNRLDRAGVFMSDTVAKPMRQFSGILASVKAVVETLRDPEAGHHPHPPQGTSRYSDEARQPGPKAVSGTPFRP
jgi:methyl-accepting chemotaxis protein